MNNSMMQNLLDDFDRVAIESDAPRVSKTDAGIMKKSYMLNNCPKKKQQPICHCQELILFTDSPEETQDDFQQLYLRAVSEDGHKGDNEFLLGCLVLNSDNNKVTYRVPHIMKDGNCRRFELCVKQLMALFGLT